MKLSLEQKIYTGFILALLILIMVGLISHQTTPREKASVDRTTVVTPIAGLLSVLLLSGAAWLIYFDIRQRKQTEAALRQSEEKYRLVVNRLKEVIFQFDLAGCLTFLNPAWTDILGYSVEESLGKSSGDFLHPDDRQRSADMFQALLQQDIEYCRHELRFVAKDGHACWLELYAQLTWAADGSLLGVSGTLNDITTRKQFEEALAKERNLMRTVIDNLPDLIFVKDVNSRFVLVNQASLQMGGQTMAEIIGKTDFEINPSELAAQYYADDLAVIQSGQPLINREECNISAGQTRWFSTTKVPLRDNRGQIVGLVGLSRDITERRQMEETLAEERNLLRAFVDHMPDCVYVKDKESRFIMANQAVAEIMGADSPADLLGKTDFDFYPKAMAANFYKDEQTIIRSGNPQINYEERLLNRSMNEERWTLASKVPFRDSAGDIIGLVGMNRDITKSKQIMSRLRESEERFRQLAETIHQAFWMVGTEYKTYIYLSSAFEEIWGRPRQSLTNYPTSFLETVHPDDLDRMRDVLAEESRRDYETEYRIVRPDGTVRWIHSHSFPIRNEQGMIYRIAGLSEDITERKRAEKALRESEALLRTVIDSTPDWIFIKDQDYRFRWVNKSFAQVVHLSPEACLGKNDLELGFPEELVKGNPEQGLPGFWDDDREVMDTGKSKIVPEIFTEIDGRQLVQSTLKVPLQDAEGKVWGVLGFIHDISDLKSIQNELQQAKDTAETATRAKSEFLANMSHEIRTPLNAIVGMTSLLLDTPLAPEQQDFAETIRTSSDTLLAIINDILDFSKIEAGKLELEKQPFDLRQCIEESLDLVAIKAVEKKLELAYLIDDVTPSALVGDVTRLRQILVNLLNNAVKFTDQGEVVLSVRSHPVKRRPAGDAHNENGPPPPPAYELHFAVRDTGIGIPAERMDRLFRSFSQVDASTTRKYGGTGLGLTISKRLSEIMGGRMWVESEGIPGEGSTFHFTVLAQAAPSQPRVYLRGQQPQLSGKRLLIIDDNATNRLILARQSQSWGMHPRAAASAEEALAWIRRGDSFDLAILDMQMPEMDGLSLAQEIRQHRAAYALPLVMLTSLGVREHNDQTAQIEFAAFLTKPIKPAQLYNTLLGVFESQPTKIRHNPVRSAGFDAQLAEDHPLRLLLAEDNAVNQKVALHMLERMGYLADVAANGLEVLQALERQPYDVILMDMQMPEMDGLEATQAIREQWPVGECPWIIAMTANAGQGDRERCLEAGMNDYISKPVRPEELARALKQCPSRLEQHAVSAPVSSSNPPDQAVDEGNGHFCQNGQVLDARVLAELRQLLGKEAPCVLVELIELYLQTATPLLDDIRNAIRQADAHALYRAAHTLKPSSAHLGAVHLAALCEELETLGQSGQLEAAAGKQIQFETEFHRVKAALELEKVKLPDSF